MANQVFNLHPMANLVLNQDQHMGNQVNLAAPPTDKLEVNPHHIAVNQAHKEEAQSLMVNKEQHYYLVQVLDQDLD